MNWPPWLNSRVLAGYVIALALPVLVLVGHFNLPIDNGHRPLMILFVPAVIGVAVLGGIGPGFVATVATAVASACCLIPADLSLSDSASGLIWEWVVVIISGCITSLLSGMVNRTRDLEHRRRREAEIALTRLGDSEARFRRVFEEMPLPLGMVDSDGRVVALNKRYGQVLGYTIEDIPNLDIWWPKAFPDAAARAEAQARWTAAVAEAAATGSDINAGEFLIACRDGQERLLSVTGIVLQNALLAAFIDLTERRRSERELAAVQAVALERQRQARLAAVSQMAEANKARAEAEAVLGALKESQERLQLLIDHAPAALAMFDYEMRYLAVSRRWLDDYLVGDCNIIGCSHLAIFSEVSDPWRKVYPRVLDGEIICEEEDRFERADGKVQWLRWEALPWHKADGSVGGIVIFSEDITGRKQAQAEMMESKAKLEAALASMSDAVFITDTDGNLIDFNDAFVSFHKFRSKEECPRALADYLRVINISLVSGEDVPLGQWAVPLALLGESATNVEYILRRNDSGESWVGSFSFAPIRNAEGVITGSVIAGRNITRQKQAEEDLRRSEARYHSVLDNAADAVFVVDRGARFIYVNRQASHLLGYSRDELLKLAIPDITPPEDAVHAEVTFLKLWAIGRLATELLLKRKDGSRVPVEINAITLPDGTAYGACRDITGRKAVEAELDQHRKKLEHLVKIRTGELEALNEKLLDTQFAMEGVGIAIHCIEADTGRMLYVNRYAADLLGYTVDEMLALRVPQFDPNFSESQFETVMHDFRSRGRVAFETINVTKDGREIPVGAVLHYLAPKGNTPGRFIIFLTDITERRASERAREAALREAERLARLRRDFLANMSHEIRTPLNAVLGLAQIGVRDNTTGRNQDLFQRILDSGQGLLGVVDDILDFAKIESGKLSLESIPFNLGEVIDRSVQAVALRAFSKGLAFSVDEASDLPARCLGDPKRLQQILINLLSNAVKFTEPGGRVDLSGQVDGGTLVFRVTDTGAGMAKEAVDRLFQPFEQADGSTTRRFGGTGLGLAITDNLVRMMEGTITVTSSLGEGSRFEVRLELPLLSPPSGPQVGRIGAFGLADEDQAVLRRGKLEIQQIDALQTLPDRTMPLVIDGAILLDSPSRVMVNAHVIGGRKVVVVTTPGKYDLPGGLSSRVSVVERPLRVRHLVAALAEGGRRSRAGPAQRRLNGLRIAAVEDNEVNRLVLEDLLTGEGAEVACFENGRVALDHLRVVGTPAFDLVITDVQMPEMDGYELARALRSTTPDLPVIGLTAHALAEERQRCHEVGMRDSLTKPVDADLLVETILRNLPGGKTSVLASGPEPAPEPAPEPVEPPAIDLPGLQARYQGRHAFIRRLLATFASSHHETANDLRSAAAAEDLDRVRALAHSLKGTAANIEAKALRDLAAQTEQAARARAPEAPELCVRLAEGLEQLLLSLTTNL